MAQSRIRSLTAAAVAVASLSTGVVAGTVGLVGLAGPAGASARPLSQLETPDEIAVLATTALASQAAVATSGATIIDNATTRKVRQLADQHAIVALATAVAARLGAPIETAQKLTTAWMSTTEPRRLAVLTGLAQVGDPYRSRGKGPDSFDCSGLTGFAWAAAGVPLAANSTLQIRNAAERAAADVQPGDLAWRPGHVMLALGVDDLVVHAPYTGTRVRVDDWGKVRKVGDPLA